MSIVRIPRISPFGMASKKNYLLTTNTVGSTFGLGMAGRNGHQTTYGYAYDIDIKVNDGIWVNYEGVTAVNNVINLDVTPGIENKIYIRDNKDKGFKGICFWGSGPLGGAIYLKEANLTLGDIIDSFQCYSMFKGCTSLVKAPKLPATTISAHGYNQMFSNCNSLVEAPELPATTLTNNSYSQMFSDCTALTAAPELPAMNLSGAQSVYYAMFTGCTSLVNVPILPATTLASNGYEQMFSGCTSLVNGPQLPATTVPYRSYSNMFLGCTSLVNAPELPAMNLNDGSYLSMFKNCSSMVNAPILPATTLAANAYSQMFNGCSSLESIYLAYGSNDNTGNQFTSWVSNISSVGKLYKKGTPFTSAGSNTYPATWTQEVWT